jgi:hypothetical protein
LKKLPLWFAPALATLFASTPATQVDYNGNFPWSQTAPSGPDAPVGGWWYNLGITGMRVELMPSRPKHLLVQYVFPFSPASGIVLPGDILTGAGGVPFDGQLGDGCAPPVVPGCTDESALNYNADATEDDGTCEFAPECADGETLVTIDMVDSYGDGWSGNTLTVADCDGNVLESDHTVEAGSTHAVDLCLVTSDGYVVTAGGGSWAEEISWTLTSPDGDVVLEDCGRRTAYWRPVNRW